MFYQIANAKKNSMLDKNIPELLVIYLAYWLENVLKILLQYFLCLKTSAYLFLYNVTFLKLWKQF